MAYATPRSPLRHITTPPLTSPTSARRHKEEVEELRTLQKKNSELRRALEQRKAYPWPSSEARQRATEYAAAARPTPPAAPRPTPPPQRPVSAAHISGRSDAPVSRSHYSPQPPPRQSLGRRNLDFDEDSATEARKLVESAAATVSAERQEARVAEATQRALTRLNELESAAAAAERRVRGAEEREATLRRVVDAAKADVRSRSRPEPCIGWVSTLAMLFLAFGAGMMVQMPYPTHVVTH
jgi:hypothetical protein